MTGDDRDHADEASACPIVAMVCSAGGLDPLLRILGALPASFPAAVVVLQHQMPDRPSALAHILQRRCAMAVEVAADGDELRPGTVVVVPPGKHLLVTSDLRVALIDSDGSPPYRPSADLLLTSLALVAGSRTIAVILSGRGRDGATGATAVHAFGGQVVAASPESSEHVGMPEEAIERDGIVDHVVDADDIAGLLQRLLAVPAVPAVP